ncbi:unnamed protein product [Allacma fusca]|uniref:Uncharacterized protein n=1 Tax=Allacma fusca TaxID=39272 RepID=A0A8J2KK78_9HEXA|nr:unnamed protein product [Allacma fusca]
MYSSASGRIRRCGCLNELSSISGIRSGYMYNTIWTQKDNILIFNYFDSFIYGFDIFPAEISQALEVLTEFLKLIHITYLQGTTWSIRKLNSKCYNQETFTSEDYHYKLTLPD